VESLKYPLVEAKGTGKAGMYLYVRTQLVEWDRNIFYGIRYPVILCLASESEKQTESGRGNRL
jgi:hypothetical protein